MATMAEREWEEQSARAKEAAAHYQELGEEACRKLGLPVAILTDELPDYAPWHLEEAVGLFLDGESVTALSTRYGKCNRWLSQQLRGNLGAEDYRRQCHRNAHVARQTKTRGKRRARV